MFVLFCLSAPPSHEGGYRPHASGDDVIDYHTRGDNVEEHDEDINSKTNGTTQTQYTYLYSGETAAIVFPTVQITGVAVADPLRFNILYNPSEVSIQQASKSVNCFILKS